MTATASHSHFTPSISACVPSAVLGIDITFWEALLLDKTLIDGQVPEGKNLTHVSIAELPAGGQDADKCRIFFPGTTITSFAWSPDRLNVYCDKYGRVFDVRFG